MEAWFERRSNPGRGFFGRLSTCRHPMDILNESLALATFVLRFL